MSKGIIKHLTDRGFGFIKQEQGEDLFFHRSELQGVDYSSLREGQEVKFEVGRGRDGRSQAKRVSLSAIESSQDKATDTAVEDVGATLSEPEAEETKQED